MTHYRITSSAGIDHGVFEADSPGDAFARMVRESGGASVDSGGRPVEGTAADWRIVPLETYRVQRDGERDITFTGERLAQYSSAWRGGRRYTAAVYRTAGGRIVCERIGETQWHGERTRHEAAICERLEDIAAFFGFDALAKELYSELAYAHGFDPCERLD